jgi:hypothetical protein
MKCRAEAETFFCVLLYLWVSDNFIYLYLCAICWYYKLYYHKQCTVYTISNSSDIRSIKRICVPHILRKYNLSYATVFWKFFVSYISVARCLSSKTQHTVYNVPRDNWGAQGLLTSMHTKSNVGISRTLISP